MRAFTLLVFITGALGLSFPPKAYPFDPRIHSLGNTGFRGKLHAKMAPFFTKAIDVIAYGGVDVRTQEVKRYENKTILDFGCGTGFSTSDTVGSLGIDTSKEMLSEARKLFPEKDFMCGHAEKFKTSDEFDIVTCMFLMHEAPSFCRKRIIDNALSIAKQEVVVIDISPFYKPSKMMLDGEPYLLDYLSNISLELTSIGFQEDVVVKGHVHRWTYKIPDVIYIEYDDNDDMYPIPTGRTVTEENYKEPYEYSYGYTMNNYYG